VDEINFGSYWYNSYTKMKSDAIFSRRPTGRKAGTEHTPQASNIVNVYLKSFLLNVRIKTDENILTVRILRIILKRISEKYGMKVWTGFVWLRIGTSGGFL
jgi:hypothetical protein